MLDRLDCKNNFLRLFIIMAVLLFAQTTGIPAALAAETAEQDAEVAGQAAETTDQAEELRTDEVYVTAGRITRQLLDVPMSVSVITEDQIRKSTANTTGELLRDIPGVQLQSSGGQGFNRISIRGEKPNRVLILIDGQKIAENKSMDGPPLLIDPARIDRIEVIRGPASVLYGSEAVGGVVNIITKKGGEKPVSAELGTFYNGASDGTGGYASLFGAHKGFNYRVSGSYADHGDRNTPSGRAHNSSYRQKDASAFLSYDFEKLTLGGGYEYFDSAVHAGSKEAGYERFKVNVPTWKLEKYSLFAESKNLTTWLPRVRMDFFTQKNHKHMFNIVDVDGMPMVLENEADNANRQIGFSTQADWLLHDRHYLITGYEMNRDKIDADTFATSTSAIAPMRYNSQSRHEGAQTSHAVFGQMESTLPADFTLNYGMRYTWVRSNMKTARGDKTNFMGMTSAQDVGATGSSSESRPVVNFGVVWSGIENLALRASFSQGFRVASLSEQYITSAMGGGTMMPNPDLKPETSNSYEIGARYAGEKLTVDVAGFYSDADDYIASIITDSVQKVSQYRNVASAKTRGIEATVSYDLPYGITPYTEATWMKRKYDFGDRTTSKTGDPEWFGRAGVRGLWTVHELADLRVDVFSRFSTRTKQESSDGAIINIGGWGTANAGAGVDFGEEREYSLNLEVLNIFDKRYTTNDAIYEPGVHANMNFSMRF